MKRQRKSRFMLRRRGGRRSNSSILLLDRPFESRHLFAEHLLHKGPYERGKQIGEKSLRIDCGVISQSRYTETLLLSSLGCSEINLYSEVAFAIFPEYSAIQECSWELSVTLKSKIIFLPRITSSSRRSICVGDFEIISLLLSGFASFVS